MSEHTTTSGVELGTNGMTPTREDDASTVGDGIGVSAPSRFEPGYERSEARILRERLRVRGDGTATARFRGQVADATRATVARGASGRISLYAAVVPDATSLTEVVVAVVPTGARTPLAPGSGSPFPALLLGSLPGAGGTDHVFLLSVDGTADRAAHDERRAARRDERLAERAAARASAFLSRDGFDDGYDG